MKSMSKIHGAEGWILETPFVQAHLTAVAGMLSSVVFKLNNITAKPYSLSPWKPDEAGTNVTPLIKLLRGDFFCFPFGPQDNGSPHGDPANAVWSLVKKEKCEITLQIECKDSGATIVKNIMLGEDHPAIYQNHQIFNLSGKWSYGSHPIIDCSNLAEESARISLSPFRWGSVYPGVFSDPTAGELQCLQPAARFDSLDSVPLSNGGTTDLSRWPSRHGFDDLVMVVSEPATDEQPFAWSAITMGDYVWFSLKNPQDFPSTLLWMSNGGRNQSPWNGSHSGRIGIEEVCSHFCDNVKISRQERLSGIPTVRTFKTNESVSLPIIHGATNIPPDFGSVTKIKPQDSETVLIYGNKYDHPVTVTIHWSFLLNNS